MVEAMVEEMAATTGWALAVATLLRCDDLSVAGFAPHPADHRHSSGG